MTRSILQRGIRFVLLLALSWTLMTFTHEVGHLICGWVGGARLVVCDLAPWRLPHSLHSPDPHPRLTLWGGPILGVSLPCLLAIIIRQRWMWCIADFCLVANGVYLALAWFTGDPHLDTPRMLAAGVPPWQIATFCFATIVVGYVRFRNDCIEILGGKPTRGSE